MPSIIFCYRILFGLQRKVSLGGGEKRFDAPLSRASPAPLPGRPAVGAAGRGQRAALSAGLPDSPTHRLEFKLFTRMLGCELGKIKRKG